MIGERGVDEISESEGRYPEVSEARFIRCNECRALSEPRALFCGRCGASLYGRKRGGPSFRRRRLSAAGAAMGIALLLALAVITIALGIIIDRSLQTTENIDPYTGQTGTAAIIGTTSTQASGTGDSDTSTTLAPVQVRPTSADASSALKATSTNSYRATNLIDGDLATAWEEGVKGPGLGEWVRFEFSRPLVIARIEIANGYQKDDERFQGNPRVKTVKVEYSNGETELIDLARYRGVPEHRPEASETIDWVKLTIVSVYEGDEWEDTALSEVRIFEQAQ